MTDGWTRPEHEPGYHRTTPVLRPNRMSKEGR